MGWGAAIVIFFAATVARGRLGRNGLRLTHYGGPKPQSGHYIKGFYVTHKNCVFALGAMLASLPVHRESKQVMRGGCPDEVTITMRSGNCGNRRLLAISFGPELGKASCRERVCTEV